LKEVRLRLLSKVVLKIPKSHKDSIYLKSIEKNNDVTAKGRTHSISPMSLTTSAEDPFLDLPGECRQQLMLQNLCPRRSSGNVLKKVSLH
jgi:hypothetical protein